MRRNTDKDRVVARLLGEEIDVNDFGICRINKSGKHIVYKVEEEDGSINWYLNYNEHSDTIVESRRVDLVRER